MTALLMLGIFVSLLAIDYVVRAVSSRTTALGTLPQAAFPALRLAELRVPGGLLFHPGHSWAALRPSGALAVGVDDFVRKIAGTIDGISVPETGTEVRQGESMATLHIGGRSLTLAAPVSGRVAAVNPALLQRPETLGTDSLEAEWLVTLEPSRLAEEFGQLSVAARATDWLQGEIGRLAEFIAMQSQSPAPALVTPPDGGEPVVGVLRQLDNRGWAAFESQFLLGGGDRVVTA